MQNANVNGIVSARSEQESIHACLSFEDLFVTGLPKSIDALQSSFYQLNDDTESQYLDTLRIVYDALVCELGSDQRLAFFHHVLEQVKSVELDPTVLKVFIQLEPDHNIVIQAVHAYLRHKVASFEDPLLAAHNIIESVEGTGVANRGAVFAALVCFGDRRVCALARTIRDSITPADARSFALAVTTPLHAATLEFCLDWLVQLVSKNNNELAMSISSALSVMVIKDDTLLISNDEYNFGPYGFSSAVCQPQVEFRSLVRVFQPILDFLAGLKKSYLDQMIEIFKNHGSLKQADPGLRSSPRRHIETRASALRIREHGWFDAMGIRKTLC